MFQITQNWLVSFVFFLRLSLAASAVSVLVAGVKRLFVMIDDFQK